MKDNNLRRSFKLLLAYLDLSTGDKHSMLIHTTDDLPTEIKSYNGRKDNDKLSLLKIRYWELSENINLKIKALEEYLKINFISEKNFYERNKNKLDSKRKKRIVL